METSNELTLQTSFSGSWIEYCEALRNRVVVRIFDRNKYALANFTGTIQGKDIEKRTPLVQDFFRVKVNVKGFSDKLEERRGMPQVDFHDNQQVFSALANEFDMPYWAFHRQTNRALKDYTNTFIWQLKACNIHCPWCYVDDRNKNADISSNSRFFSISEIIDVFQEERKKAPLYMLRASGGEPTLGIEQWLETLQELDKRGLSSEVYHQSDTNLTTGHFLEHLEEAWEIPKNILNKIAEFRNFGLLCSFKGTNLESMLQAYGFNSNSIEAKNTYSFLEQERLYSFARFVKAGIDAYPFIYDPKPKTLSEFMEQGARMFGNGFYLKTWIVPLKLYDPEKQRIEKLGINPEDYQKQLDSNFKQSEEVMQELIWKKFGLNYKAVPRTGIELKYKPN